MPKKATAPKESSYQASDIDVLEGLEAVRVRPGMYIGNTDLRGMHHIIWEIVDNSMDEAANKYATMITVTVNEDGSVAVEDNGRGIPVDIHPTKKVPAVELVFTQLHAGGKFGNKNYNYSGGLHGVGASVTNALSEWLTVEVYRGGKIYREEFHSPEKDGKVESGIIKTPLTVVGKTDKKGTRVEFLPDKRVFKGCRLDNDIIEKRLREYAFLNKGVLIKFDDNRPGEDTHEEFLYTDGLLDFINYINEGIEEKKNGVMYLTADLEKFRLEVAVQHTESYTEHTYSFVNNIPTPEGGTHETGFRSAFTRFMNDYARENKILKDKDPNLTGDDFREGMTAIVSIYMQDPQFEGQTKGKLGNAEIKPLVENLVYDKMAEFFKSPKNKPIAQFIFKKATDAAKTREAARKAKIEQRQKNSITGATLVGKFASCTSKDPVECELFIVEGDSAGGSAKQGRDRRTQAVLPLRGKPLNVLKAGKRENIYKNEEIATIIAALGTDTESDFNMDNLKFHKVIILSDADYDGYHIRTLLLAMFHRLMPELILQGKIYVGMPPLYKVEKKGVAKYAYNEEELDALTEEMKAGAGDVQRYKGLGEMSKEQLWETTLNPRTRTLTRVQMDDAMAASEMLDLFMTEGAEKRKEYIFRHAKFNKVDTFLEKFGG